MSRIHGRKGRMYVGMASAAADASPVAYLSSWSINFDTDDVDVTAFGDENKTWESGLPDVGGDFAGFYDTESSQLYTAATDGASRKFYLYPTTDDTSKYYFGTGKFDMKVTTPVAGAVTVSGNWKAASKVTKVPA